MSKRRTHSPEFKARVAMEAISGRMTIQEITSEHANVRCCDSTPDSV
jgi:transposase-like protein